MEEGKDLGKTSMGMAPNVAAGLCYLLLIVPLGIIAPIVFFAAEKENKFVKFNAMQAIILAVAVYIIVLVTAITVIIPIIVGIAGLIAVIMLAIKSFSGEKMKLPLIGEWAEKFAA